MVFFRKQIIISDVSSVTKRVFRVVFSLLLIAFVYALQGIIFPFLSFFKTNPLLLPMLAVAIGINEKTPPGTKGGRERDWQGAAFGLVAGVLCDMAEGGPPGIFTVMLTLVAIVAAAIDGDILRRGFRTFLLMSAGSLIACGIAQMLVYLLFLKLSLFSCVAVILRQTLISLPFAPVVYFLARPFSGKKRTR
jgi:rod shape-determining protein MreD